MYFRKRNLKIFSLFAILTLLVVLFLNGCGSPSTSSQDKSDERNLTTEKPIVLKAVTYEKDNAEWTKSFWILKEKVDKQMGDKLKIERIGGPETIPSLEQPNAVKDGTVDMVLTVTGWLGGFFPEAEVIALRDFTPMEAREKGLYDYFANRISETLNSYYAAEMGPGVPFYLFSNFKVDSLDDFKGRSFRVAGNHRVAVQALGGEAVSLPIEDIYPAAERGVVDGFAHPAINVISNGYDEVVKYRLGPGFNQSSGALLINMNTWEKIPEDVREEFKKLLIEVEKESLDYYRNKVKEEEKILFGENRMEKIEFSPELTKKFLETIYDGQWKELEERAPERVNELKKILAK